MEERFESRAPIGLNVLLTKEPYRDFVVVARNLFQDALRPSSMFEANGMSRRQSSILRLKSGWV